MVNNKSSPLTEVVPLLNGLSMSSKWGLLSTYKSWDDPPSWGLPPIGPWFCQAQNQLEQKLQSVGGSSEGVMAAGAGAQFLQGS